MTPEAKAEILAAEAQVAVVRIEIAAKQSELATIESYVASMYRKARRKAKLAAVPKVSKVRTRERVYRHMVDAGRERFTLRQVTRDLGLTEAQARHALLRLTDSGRIVRVELGVYAVKREAEAAE